MTEILNHIPEKSNSITHYSPELIRNIGENIKAELSEDIIENLLEIKLNNKFIRRRSPIKLKYNMKTSVADAWRKEKEDGEMTEESKFIEEINSNLNKLTTDNYLSIEEKIKTTVLKYNDSMYREILINLLFEKSISEKTFCNLYARLCTIFIEIFGDEFKNELLSKTEAFYAEKIDKEFYISDHSKISYDELCQKNKEKSKLLGVFIFIGGLYEHKIITHPIVMKYFNILMESSLNTLDDSNSIEKYIECMTTLVTQIGNQLEEELEEMFEEMIISKLKIITNDKKNYKPRTRFLILDLFDLRNKKWKT